MKLAAREKGLLTAAAILAALVVGYQIYLEPATERVNTLKRVIPERRNDLRQLRLKIREYESIQKELGRIRERVGSRDKEFKILSFLERAQKACGLAERVAYMKPATSFTNEDYMEKRVEIKVEGVTLEQVARFLFRVQSQESLVGIKELHIKKATGESSLLDVAVAVTTLTSTQGQEQESVREPATLE